MGPFRDYVGLCEAVFSTMVSVKTKTRNRLNFENNFWWPLATTKPRIEILMKEKEKRNRKNEGKYMFVYYNFAPDFAGAKNMYSVKHN